MLNFLIRIDQEQETDMINCRIGIVILNYETWELSLRCMKSIHASAAGCKYKIYLIDNASKRPMPQAVKDYLALSEPDACYIHAEKNRGYAAGNNLGLKNALDDGCSVVIVANNDIIFKNNAMKRLAECLLRCPKAGIAGPKVINEAGQVQISRCSMKTGMKEIIQIFTAAKKISRRKWKTYYCLDKDPNRKATAYYVSGCCFAISRECAKKVTPLDEGTVLFYEELILGLRMEQAGYKTIYEPSSVVIHQHGATTNTVQPFMHQCISQSELYYCSRYLGAKKYQLWLLYQYRRLLYRMRCIGNVQFKEYWKIFDKATRKAYDEAGKFR